MNTATDRTFKRKPYFNIYKPLMKEDAGAAFQFSYDTSKQAVFLEASRQKGAKLPIGDKNQFDWDNKIVFKIGASDIGKLLLLFAGRTKKATCLHSQQGSGKTSVLEMTKGEYKGEPNFGCQLSKIDKSGDTPINQRVSLFINQEEMMLLAHFIRESLTRILGFAQES